MKTRIIRKIVVFMIIMAPVVAYQGCKKQPKCGCGKDLLFELKDQKSMVILNEATNSAYFYPLVATGATYIFCDATKWIDTLKTMNMNEYLLVSGKAYYECNYLMNSGNSYYQMPPVYQVEVTAIMEDNYGKK
jgi:hypothetical protein